MKYRVNVTGRFGEGWKEGDIVDMDFESARVPLQQGEISEHKEVSGGLIGHPPECSPATAEELQKEIDKRLDEKVPDIYLGDLPEVHCVTCKTKTIAKGMNASKGKSGWYAKGICSVCEGKVSKKVKLDA